jgi:DNA-binding transcriptional ArsR family regulator
VVRNEHERPGNPLAALVDGRAWTAGELARHAGVVPSTAGGHLGRLAAGALLAEERQGRHRYVRLAAPRTTQLIEAPAAGPARCGAVSAGSAMAQARTCYDHLAGWLGIAVPGAVTRRGLLRRATGFAVTWAWPGTPPAPPRHRSRRPGNPGPRGSQDLSLQ